MKCAILTGTGIYQVPGLDPTPVTVKTPFGPACYYATDRPDLIFLPRHGSGHTVPPHRIAYRANFWALHQLGVEAVLAAYAVGSVHHGVPAGSLALLDDFLDCTEGRERTFFDGGAWGVGHADMSQPYCPALRARMLDFAASGALEVKASATYACTNGPRVESPAEIRDLARRGADVVGMTGLPEVVLARELGMHFAGVALSINLGVGLQDKLRVVPDLQGPRQQLLELLLHAASGSEPDGCQCVRSVDFLAMPQEALPRSVRLERD